MTQTLSADDCATKLLNNMAALIPRRVHTTKQTRVSVDSRSTIKLARLTLTLH